MRALRGLWGVVLVLSSCIGGVSNPLTGAVGLALPAFQDCDELLAYVKQHALEQVTPYGLPGGYGGVVMSDVAAAEAGGDAAASRAGSVPTGRSYSETNVQTAGVDEPDIVKTDGQRLIVLSDQRLMVFDVSTDRPALLGTLRLEGVWPRDLLFLGDRALVLGEGQLGAGASSRLAVPDHGYGGAVSALVEIDLTDPSAPRVARRLLVDGRYLSARMHDGVARIVVSSYPTGLDFTYPEGGGLRGERDALERNREVIRSSTLENWVPYFVVENEAGGVEAEGSLLDCDTARHPQEFSGLGMLTVLTFDLAEGLTGDVRDGSVGVLADGETVYASTEALYVATQRWMDWTAIREERADDLREGHVTQIHRFDISGGGPAEYRATGEVPGWLLNQFSMDEFEGHLRVASTDAPPDFGGPSESMVTVLADRDGVLEQIGQVTGLGIDERIYAVRFMGDLGYVVTFREVDPLYVVDLRDPATPRVAGELKIPGYSAYLHPLGDGLLLGVGQDATKRGMTRGTQMSLFDVSDPTSPERIDQIQIAGGSSEAEWDHHAFLYWEPESLVVLPLSVYCWDEVEGDCEGFSGALAIRAEGRTLDEVARIEHGRDRRYQAQVRRSLVIGDLLYTVSHTSLRAVDLGTFDEVAEVSFR
jgi:uncharacterized secreted protein with C-terminal beta-propeller domain